MNINVKINAEEPHKEVRLIKKNNNINFELDFFVCKEKREKKKMTLAVGADNGAATGEYRRGWLHNAQVLLRQSALSNKCNTQKQ